VTACLESIASITCTELPISASSSALRLRGSMIVAQHGGGTRFLRRVFPCAFAHNRYRYRGCGIWHRRGAQRNAAKRWPTAQKTMRSALGSCAPVPVRAKLDRRDVSEHCLLLEAMNIGFVGPNLNLAVGADPDDGWLDVVLVTETARNLLDHYLAAEERGDSRAAALPGQRGHTLQIEWSGFAMHIDDKRWPSRRPESRKGKPLSQCRDGADFLVPSAGRRSPRRCASLCFHYVGASFVPSTRLKGRHGE
jgi:hypothetical protein